MKDLEIAAVRRILFLVTRASTNDPDVSPKQDLAEAAEVAFDLLLNSPPVPRPLVAVDDWLLVENPDGGKLWRSSFRPPGWALIQEPPLELRHCLNPRLDHALEQWARRIRDLQPGFEELAP